MSNVSIRFPYVKGIGGVVSFSCVFVNYCNLFQSPRVVQHETYGVCSRDFKLLCFPVSFPSLSCLSVVLMQIRLFMAMFPTL